MPLPVASSCRRRDRPSSGVRHQWSADRQLADGAGDQEGNNAGVTEGLRLDRRAEKSRPTT